VSSTADLLEVLLRNEISAVCAAVEGALSTNAPRPAVLLPGSFNPVHTGHWRLAEVGAALVGGPAAFELSVVNVDKPALSAAEVCRRLAQFTGRAPVWITGAPTFVEKASLFPGVVFVVGADTAERLAMPRYYQNGELGMAEAFARVRQLGCRFLVAGREDSSGRFVDLDGLSIPADFRDLFTAIPQSAFHIPLSSTALRQRGPDRGSVAPVDQSG
jgi:hypothetical protein